MLTPYQKLMNYLNSQSRKINYTWKYSIRIGRPIVGDELVSSCFIAMALTCKDGLKRKKPRNYILMIHKYDSDQCLLWYVGKDGKKEMAAIKLLEVIKLLKRVIKGEE